MSQSFFQSVRFPVWVGALFLGAFLFMEARETWTRYWLLKDQRQEIAIVTHSHDRHVVDYSYRVNGREYRGNDRERYITAEHRYGEVFAGGSAVVYYSSSHPWLRV